MTKEITKARVLQEIQDKFKLREFEHTPFLFSETVTPVYSMEPHLEVWEHEYKRISITSAASFTFFVVPQTEKWHIRAYSVIFLGSGAIKITGVYVSRKATPTRTIYLDMKESQIISYVINLPQVCVLQPGDVVAILCDDYTSTQSLDLYLDVMKEEIR